MSGSEGGLDRVLAQLESEQMPADVAAACLALSIICNQPRGPLPLKGLAAKLIPLLQSKDTAVQVRAAVGYPPLSTRTSLLPITHAWDIIFNNR
jgi:hypothetical protein